MDKIFDRFSSLKINKKNERFTVSVYGRTYTFENSFLPVSIIAKGEELLASPIELNIDFLSGKSNFRNFNYIYLENDEQKAEVLASAECGNLVINATLTFEFDGFIKVEMRISNFWSFSQPTEDDNMPEIPKTDISDMSKAHLSGLSIKIPLKKQNASLFHYWPNDKTSIIPSATTMNSGKVVFTDYPFKPYVWCGDEYRGLGFWCESDKGFELEDEDRCISVTETNRTVEVGIRILDRMPLAWQKQERDLWVDTLHPLFYTFGFQATPVKALPEDMEDYYKRFHLYDVMQHNIYESDVIEKVAEAGAKWLILHEDWTAIQNYGLPHDEDKFCEFVKKAHGYGLKVMTYFGYEYSSLAPDFSKKAEEYLIKNPRGNFTGGWQRQVPQRAYMVCYNGAYSEVMTERIKHVMDNYGVDGIYTDGTYVPWECANEAHGCGYRDDCGKLHTTFPILAVREHVKKLYLEVHKRGGIIDTHQSSCCLMPTLAFADSYFDGENIQGAMKEDINFLNLEAFRCEYMGLNMGLTNNFITYIPFENVAAISLIHNVMPRVNHLDILPKIKKIWDIYDENSLNDAKFCPYWEDNTILSEDCITASTYICGGDKVIVFTNYDKDKTSANFDFCGGYTTAVDLLSGESYPLVNGKGEIPAKYFSHNIFRVF